MRKLTLRLVLVVFIAVLLLSPLPHLAKAYPNIIDPNGLAYTPDQILLGNGEVLYLLSRAYSVIFRYDIGSRQYLPSIPLSTIPSIMAYDSALNRLYISDNSSKVNVIRLDESLDEHIFISQLMPYSSIAVAGQYLMTIEPDTSFAYYKTWDKDGNPVSSYNHLAQPSSRFTWCEGNRRMYHFWSGVMPVDLYYTGIDTNGVITVDQDSPYHGDYPLEEPLEVKLDCSAVLTGVNGEVFDGSTLTHIKSLGNNSVLLDGAWVGDSLYTYNVLYVNSVNPTEKNLIQYDASYQKVKTIPLQLGSLWDSGNALRLIAVKEGLLVTNLINNIPRFTIYDLSLNPVFVPPIASFTVSVKGRFPLSVYFNSSASTGQISAYQWDFGDGQSSTEASPTHVYTQQGPHTVKLTVSGPSGEDTATHEVPVFYQSFIPQVSRVHKVYSKPGTYTINQCKNRELWISGMDVGLLTECVSTVKVSTDGTLRVGYSWQVDIKPEIHECVNKDSDWGNDNMYLTDNLGDIHHMIGAGNAALGVSCMSPGFPYSGWFDFAPIEQPADIFTFHDDDQGFLIQPINIPLQ